MAAPWKPLLKIPPVLNENHLPSNLTICFLSPMGNVNRSIFRRLGYFCGSEPSNLTKDRGLTMQSQLQNKSPVHTPNQMDPDRGIWSCHCPCLKYPRPDAFMLYLHHLIGEETLLTNGT